MNIVQATVQRHRAGQGGGIVSVCSAHPTVLRAAFCSAADHGAPALIEATCNQVNQEGGYTGMRPADFRERVLALADGLNFPAGRLVLGGDHLGPNPWRSRPAAEAMGNAAVMVAEYAAAGFGKIHLDCSMRCADDPSVMDDGLIAERTALLCAHAERAAREAGHPAPVYVIGSEVPVPGGAHETLSSVEVTRPAAVVDTVAAHRDALTRHGLEEAWGRVVGLVVQPGVEFDHHHVIDYVPSLAVRLSQCVDALPNLVFEAHSTDYQMPGALAQLVRDHFAILKVGPGLTYAMREALWGLMAVGEALGLASATAFRRTVLQAMRDDPRHWNGYYTDEVRIPFDLQYSLSDRIRYYWSVPVVESAETAFLDDLERRGIPLTLLSQFMPIQYAAVRTGTLNRAPRALVRHAVQHVLAGYAAACAT